MRGRGRSLVVACGPTGSPTWPATPASAGWSSAACTCSARSSEHGLREAVEGPARQAGLLIEPGLVDLLVREVEGDPGALPLLSHALLETWKRREGSTLTVAGYRASGGIRGAVAQSAERLYARVDADSAPLLRDLVLRLVSPGTEGEPVRSRVPRRLVATDPEHDQLIEHAGRRPAGDQRRRRPRDRPRGAGPRLARLRGWLDDDVEGQRILHHLSAPPTPGTRWAAPTASSTAASGWPGRSTGRPGPPPRSPTTERDFLAAARTRPRPRQRAPPNAPAPRPG